MIILETSRLVLREFSAADAPFIIELVNTPSWLRYIGDRKIRTKKDALKYLENGPLKSYRENGFGLYMVELKADGAKAGMCGLIKRETLDDVDIGFAFLPAFGGKGFAYESAAAVVDFAKASGMKRLVAITLAENENSIKLLGKLSMNFERMIKFPDEEKELMLFAINFQP